MWRIRLLGGGWCLPTLLLLLVFTSGEKRAYPQGCATKIPLYYDYENYTFPSAMTLDPEDYRLTRRIGSGKFSDVFEAIGPEDDDNYVVIKCLKPVSERKIKREVLVLQRCRHVANLARLVGIVLHNNNNNNHHLMPSLVLQHAGREAEWLCHGDSPLSDYEIRYYVCHLLVALDGLHSVGIMHRDVKPRNVLINRQPSSPQPLMLIDLGLADFFLPATAYNVRVASRNYKSPELLTGMDFYDYSIDLWGVGCILAGLLLHREPFFHGRNNVDQLGKIVSVLGVKDLIAFLHKYNLHLSSPLQEEIQKHASTTTNRKTLTGATSTDGLDLLNHLLVYDPDERYTAHQALQHPYFDPVRERVHQEVRFRRPTTTATSRSS